MADLEAAARAPPVLPRRSRRTLRTAAAEVKSALADAVIYCFVSALFVGCAASIALVVARYAVSGGAPYAYAAVVFARDVFLRALVAVVLFCPCTILLLVLRLHRRQPQPPEELLVIEGVHVTVQVHGPEHPGALGWRRGSGYGLIPLLIFVVFSMGMMLGLLLHEPEPAAKGCRVPIDGASALIGDIGSFVCSVMVISVFIPHMLVQLRNIPRWLGPDAVTPGCSVQVMEHMAFCWSRSSISLLCQCACDHKREICSYELRSYLGPVWIRCPDNRAAFTQPRSAIAGSPTAEIELGTVHSPHDYFHHPPNARR